MEIRIRVINQSALAAPTVRMCCSAAKHPLHGVGASRYHAAVLDASRTRASGQQSRTAQIVRIRNPKLAARPAEGEA
jgi:hypothetical protein